MYTIKEMADLAGITPRTLRFYDQKGLLRPAMIGENGYRYYDRDNVLRLQQILFYRELDLPLQEIENILDQPGFQLLAALEEHQAALQNRISQYQKLLGTVVRTISNLKGVEQMEDQEYFDGFDEEMYQEEARERWGSGERYQESQRKWSSYSAAQKEEIKQLGGEITVRMVTVNPDAKPGDPDVQKAVGDYYAYLNKYFYSCDTEFLRCLAEMWEQDPRFAINYERVREGGSAFVRQAVEIFCDRALEKGG